MPTTARPRLGNLAREASSFVGRRWALGEVKRRLTEARLVTLTGVGGVGKTRLVLRAAAELQRAFPHGVWLVDLTQLREPSMLTQEIHDPDMLAYLVGATLGVRQQGTGSPLAALVQQLAGWQALLILDNCEQLIPASAVVADAILRGCPELRILATSREPLTIAGEALFAVPPLPTPDPRRPANRAELSRSEAVALFLARAEAVLPGFALTEDNQLAVAELCHRLDGLPLAIELAAARIRVLTPQQILDRLTNRFALLNRGSRSAPARQQTLRACVDWSFELCAKPERLLWERLSVFTGGFELDAVEGICADEHLPEADLLDVVAGLVDKSIVVRDNGQDQYADYARFRMLETIREYGQAKLHAAGEGTQLRRRHRDWFVQLAARARAEWVSDRQTYWMGRLGRAQHNLRAAVEFCLTEPGEEEAALRIAASLPQSYWRARSLGGEGQRWLDRALAEATAATELRARALLVNSELAFGQGDAIAGMRLLEAGEELAGHLDSAPTLAHAGYLRGLGPLFNNDLPGTMETLTRAAAILARAPEQDLDLYLTVLVVLGSTAALAGDHERASAYHQEVLAILEPRGGDLHWSLALHMGGLIAWRQGDLSQAAAQMRESLRRKRPWAADDRYGVALCLDTLAWITADQRQHHRAAALLGAADTVWTELGASITSYRHMVGFHDRCERQIRDALGDDAFAEAFRQGHVPTHDDAIAYALDEAGRRPSAPPQQETSTPLTRRERQVADLIAQGLSNKDIAAALVISQRTAESHVEHILTKLGFTSRAQVAAWEAAQKSADQDS
jgi:predicted ATPase/DNA-binding CsgD family transcriptional regulator